MWKRVEIVDRLTFLGTGDAMGVPRVYCDCRVCQEARTAGVNRRLRSSVSVETAEGEIWIDCGPDWRAQMERRGSRELSRLLLTHAHFDHMGGLPEWADACRWTRKKGELYGPGEVLETVDSQYPWLKNHLKFHSLAEPFHFGGWAVSFRKMNHGKNGFSYAYRWDKPGYSWAYCPDSIDLQGEQREFLRSLDLLVLGTSFYREDAAFESRSVYDMVEAIELTADICPASVRFTHMSHGVDIREEYPLPEGFQLAKAGMEVLLQPSQR